MWRLDEIVWGVVDGLRRADEQLRLEQAVYGLDARDEVTLHPMIAGALRDAGFGVLREQPYPSEWRHRRKAAEAEGGQFALPLPRDRSRCDLVLTPSPDQALLDPVRIERAGRRDRAAVRGTLFEGLSADVPAGTSGVSTVACEDALWIEVKAVGQHTCTAGVPGPNRGYASELLGGPLRDLKKLGAEGAVRHGGVMLVLFTQDERTAALDLVQLTHRSLDAGLSVGGFERQSFGILDRIGNGCCTVALLPVHKI